MSKSSLALSNLRGFAILNVVAFHAFIAYLGSNPASPPPFSSPPYEWSGKPVIDSARWLGFDIYCAFQYLYLMQLMFFLSGLFVWTSLKRKGGRTFLMDRLMRLGVPFLIGLYLLMPLAYYPAYLMTATDPSWPAFWAEWTALPMWPSGPMWFLWFLFALNIAAAGLHALAPRAGDYLGRLALRANETPRPFFIAFVAISALTYIPLALVFNPWDWMQFGPFGVQPSFAPQYVLYFLAGLGVGACGLERGLLAGDGTLVRHWRLLLGGTLGGFTLWIIPTALIVEGGSTIPGLQISRRSRLCAFRRRGVFRPDGDLPALRGEAVARVRSAVGQCLWHLFRPLRVRDLAAVSCCSASRCSPSSRQGSSSAWRWF